MELEGRVAVVTGGGNGIGAALVHRLAAAGVAGVLVADLDGAAANRVAAQVTAAGCRAVGLAVDVADRAAVQALVGTAERELGAVDVLCSNAGIGTGAGLDAGAELWQRAWEVNVLAHVHTAEAVLPGMLERGAGAIVTTCSAAGLLTMLGDAPYAVTKHAAVALTEWLAITYGPRGIQVSALCPQGVDTALLREGTGSVAAAAVRAAGPVLPAEAVADEVIAALGDGRFLVLPHPEVAEHLRRKGADPQRWIASLQRIAVELGAVEPGPG